MRLETKKEIVKKLNTELKTTETAFLVDYRGMNVATITKLRQELRKHNGSFQVVKNSLARLACEGTAAETLVSDFNGPIAITTANEFPVEISKTLLNFIKEHPEISIKSALLQGKRIDVAEVEALAKLPAMEILYAQLLGTITAPIQSIYTLLKENSRMVLRVINAKIEKED